MVNLDILFYPKNMGYECDTATENKQEVDSNFSDSNKNPNSSLLRYRRPREVLNEMLKLTFTFSFNLFNYYKEIPPLLCWLSYAINEEPYSVDSYIYISRVFSRPSLSYWYTFIHLIMCQIWFRQFSLKNQFFFATYSCNVEMEDL